MASTPLHQASFTSSDTIPLPAPFLSWLPPKQKQQWQKRREKQNSITQTMTNSSFLLTLSLPIQNTITTTKIQKHQHIAIADNTHTYFQKKQKAKLLTTLLASLPQPLQHKPTPLFHLDPKNVLFLFLLLCFLLLLFSSTSSSKIQMWFTLGRYYRAPFPMILIPMNLWSSSSAQKNPS